jgi:hypothetical protein
VAASGWLPAAGLERLLHHFGGELRALIAAVRAHGQRRYEEELPRLRAKVAELRSELAVAGEVPRGDDDTKKSAGSSRSSRVKRRRGRSHDYWL